MNRYSTTHAAALLGKILAINLLMIALAAVVEPQDVPVKIVDSMQKSIVPILCMQPDAQGNPTVKQTLGTGFLINRQGHFATAAHVVLDLKTVCGENSFWAIYATKIPWSRREKLNARWFRFTECRYNETTDVAVCKTLLNPFAEPTVTNNIQPVRFGTLINHADGSPVAFSGFPLGSIVPITSKGFIATYFAIEDWFGIDKSGWPGASGSPVYDLKGAVIGIVIKRGQNDGSGLTFARPIDPILKFFAAENIPLEK